MHICTGCCTGSVKLTLPGLETDDKDQGQPRRSRPSLPVAVGMSINHKGGTEYHIAYAYICISLQGNRPLQGCYWGFGFPFILPSVSPSRDPRRSWMDLDVESARPVDSSKNTSDMAPSVPSGYAVQSPIALAIPGSRWR